MSQEFKQQLSAFIDGELDSSSGRFLLRRLGQDRDLVECWERWHLARDCMQRQRITPMRGDFAARVAAALAAEARPAARAGTTLRWAGGLAVAASVAFVALLALPSQTQAPAAQPDTAIAVAAAPAVGSGAQVAPSGVDGADLQPSLRDVAQTVSARSEPVSPAIPFDPRIEAFLLRHDGALRDAGQADFTPFIPVAAPPRPWTMVPPAGNESVR